MSCHLIFVGDIPRNGGQIIRKFLEKSCVDISNFVVFGGGSKIRKCKRRYALIL